MRKSAPDKVKIEVSICWKPVLIIRVDLFEICTEFAVIGRDFRLLEILAVFQ